MDLMKKISIILLLTVIFAGLGTIPVVKAAGEPWIITEDTTLTEDYYGTVIIAADGVTLDGDGYSIIGSGFDVFNYETGILIEGRTGVTVIDCVIRDVLFGIQVLDGSSNIEVSGNNLVDIMIGVSVRYSSDVTITDNNASTVNPDFFYGKGIGYSVSYSESCTLTGNTATNNESMGTAFSFYDPADLTAIDNYAHDAGVGFYFSYAEDSVIKGNTAESNSYDGFHLVGENNKLEDNSAINNGRYGFQIYGYGYDSTQNTLTRNKAINNLNGFMMEGAMENTFRQNEAINNRQSGFEIHWNCRDNVFEDNTAAGNVYGFRSAVNYYRYPTKENTFTRNTAYRNNAGFWLQETYENTLLDNNAHQNSNYGYLLQRSSKNALTGNEATENSVGFNVISYSNENLFTRNTAEENSVWGAYQEYTCRDNEWTHNRFDVTSGLP